MKVFSKTHAFTIAASALAFVPKGADGKPLPKTNLVQAPAGTLFDMPDDLAANYVDEELATEYKEDEHGPATDGVVHIDAFQRVKPTEVLPEGQTRPSVVRLEETLNDGRTPPKPAGVVVVGDAKENADAAAARAAADKAALDAANAAAAKEAADKAAAAGK